MTLDATHNGNSKITTKKPTCCAAMSARAASSEAPVNCDRSLIQHDAMLQSVPGHTVSRGNQPSCHHHHHHHRTGAGAGPCLRPRGWPCWPCDQRRPETRSARPPARQSWWRRRRSAPLVSIMSSPGSARLPDAVESRPMASTAVDCRRAPAPAHAPGIGPGTCPASCSAPPTPRARAPAASQ